MSINATKYFFEEHYKLNKSLYNLSFISYQIICLQEKLRWNPKLCKSTITKSNKTEGLNNINYKYLLRLKNENLKTL